MNPVGWLIDIKSLLNKFTAVDDQMMLCDDESCADPPRIEMEFKFITDCYLVYLK